MNPADDWQKVNEVFEAALEIEGVTAQHEFVSRACYGDEKLRTKVQGLLSANHQVDVEGFMRADALLAGARVLTADESVLPTYKRIGNYHLIREIGRGGMGAVYLAKREDFKQEVALKIIKRGMDTDDVVRRFLREREVLATLKHPHIAHLLDGGTTPDGLPFIVMEYVEGKPVTEYCEEQSLSVEELLVLFRKICLAVSYAHQNLVVHRDLKPSNILVTADGEPKLLDFGIARLLTHDETGQTIEQTAAGVALLTPEYASPEQIRGEKITTASDIYSLGVLLYELLTYTRPYKIKSRNSVEFIRAVCETEPERPSSAISRASSLGGVTTGRDSQRLIQAGRLSKSLKGDLDNIVLKALKKEPGKRYSSVEQFSEDIKRHLEGLPVLARAGSFGYGISKFIRRNRVPVAFAAVAFIALLVGLSVAIWQAIEVGTQRAKAEQRFKEVRRLANTLLTDLDEELKRLPGNHPARVKLARVSSEYLNGLAQETNDPVLLKELAIAYTRLGSEFGEQHLSSEEARTSLIRAIEISRKAQALAPTDLDVKHVLTRSLFTYLTLFGHEDRESSLRKRAEILSLQEEIVAADPTIENLTAAAFNYFHCGRDFELLGRDVQARQCFARQARIMEQQIAELSPTAETADERITLAYKYLILGVIKTERLSESGEEYSRRGMEIAVDLMAKYPDDRQAHAAVIDAHLDLGEFYRRKKEFSVALSFYRAGVITARQFNARSPKTWGDNRKSMVYLNGASPSKWGVEREVSLLLGRAVCLHETGARREALAKVREAFALRRAFTDTHLSVLPGKGNGLGLFFAQLQTFSLGIRVLALMGESAEAHLILREVEETWNKVAAEPLRKNEFSNELALIYLTLGDLDAGCQPDNTHPEILPSYDLGITCIKAKNMGKLKEARYWYEKAVNALTLSEKETAKLETNKILQNVREKASFVDSLLRLPAGG